MRYLEIEKKVDGAVVVEQLMTKSADRIVVSFPFIGDHVGGSHISAIGLIRHLDRSRYQPLIVLHQPSGPLADLLNKLDIPFETAPIRNYLKPGQGSSSHNIVTLASVARTLPPLVRFLREKNVAIVHTNDGRVHVTWGLAARISGAKLLWHHRSDPGSFGLRCIAPWLANSVVAVSRFASPRGWLSAERKCSVVHSPFDVGRALEIDRSTCRSRLIAELKCSSESWLLGYMGTLQERKRPLVFVEAIAELRRLAPELDVRGVYFGDAIDGFDEAVRMRATALGIGDRIHLLGFRFPGEPWMAALDLLLVTAVDEPYGRTLIEAMLLGTPVVAAASGGNVEAIENGRTGLLVQPDDASAFADAATILVRSPARRAELADAAARSARSRYGFDLHVRAISEIYERLLTV